MARAYKRKGSRRDTKAPYWGHLLRRRFGLEQLCDECSRPYLGKTEAKPIEQIVHGSVVASIYIEQRFDALNYHIQIGRFGTDGSRLFISNLLSPKQLEDVAQVVVMARNYIRGQKPLRLVSRK